MVGVSVARGGTMLDQGGHVTCCVDSAGSGTAELIARRRLLKAAVFAPRDAPGQISAADGAGAPPGPATQPRVLTGTVVDASPHILTVRRADSEERLSPLPRTKDGGGGGGGAAPPPPPHSGG